MAKITNETIEKDYETGEIKKTSVTNTFKGDEPNYIKIYLDDIAYLYNVPKAGSSLIFELFNYITYNTNELILNSSVKKKIATKIGITVPSLANLICSLVSKKILKRIDTGIYMLNPYLFGKGDWQTLKQLRNENIELVISYDCETNERTITTKIEEKEQLEQVS